jgi:hypothetical protein
MQRMTRILLAAVCLVALAVTGTARAEGGLSKPELQKKLRAAYDAFNRDPGLKALEQRAMANLKDRAAVDAFLKRMPLSPMEYLQIDMEVRLYEIMIPRYIHELHIRWMELHEPLARLLYGDAQVNQVLTRWPADTGDEILGEFAAATVGANRNAASTDSPAPIEYDGEIQIAVNHRNTNQIVAASNTWGNAGAACNNEDTQSIFYSSNGGTTWDYTCAPSNNMFNLGTCSSTVRGGDPALYWNDNNEVFLNYMLLCGSGSSTKWAMVVARSADGGATWVNQGVIKNSWGTVVVEDKNFYAIDNTPTSPFYGRHYTCWDRANNEKLAYSTNNGATWTEVDLPTAPVGGSDLGCEIAVQKNGTVHVVWDSLACGANCTDERMWYTRSINGGVSWSSPVQVRDFNLVGFSGANKPPAADQRGILPFGAIDVDNSGGACDGTLYVTFSDWTSGGATETDVWVSRSTNGGTTWSAPVKVNDDGLAGRTQFHPFLQVDQSNGHVVVAWHDARNDADNRRVEYYAARSIDCGVSFEANVKASQPSAEFNNSGISYTSENTTDNPNRNINQYGEYMGLDVKNGKAYLAWVDSRHFFPGSSTNAQKENVGFAVVDFSSALPKDAQCVSQSVPSTMAPGQSTGVSITLRNTGTVTWSPVGPQCGAYRLGSINPYNNTTWGFSRVELPGPVPPGGEVTLPFTVTAPSTPGTYNFQWRMVHECVEWFGGACPNVAVNVVSPQSLPVASFTFSCTGSYCTFDGAGSTGTGLTYSWNFGDSSTPPGSGVTTAHGYPNVPGIAAYTVTLTVTDSLGRQASKSKTVSVVNGGLAAAPSYFAVAPCRILDTRNTTILTNAQPRVVNIAGLCGIPSTAKAVSFNVTAVSPTGSGQIRLYPGDLSFTWSGARSSINFAPATSPRANSAVISLATNGAGTLGIYPEVSGSPGQVHLVLDVQGYFSADWTPAPGAQGPLRFQTLSPCRMADTRPSSPLVADTVRTFTAQGVCGMPAGAAVASLHVGVPAPAYGGYISLFPSNITFPGVSTINFTGGISNLHNAARAKLSPTTPDLSAYYGGPAGASVHAYFDVNGYFKSDAPLHYQPLIPCRSVASAILGTGTVTNFQIRGNCGVPVHATAALLNVVVAAPTSASDLTVYPSNLPRSAVAVPTVTFDANEPGLSMGTIVPLSTLADDLAVSPGQMTTGGTVVVSVDVFGYFY